MNLVRRCAQNAKAELDVTGVAEGELITALILAERPVVLTPTEPEVLLLSTASAEASQELEPNARTSHEDAS